MPRSHRIKAPAVTAKERRVRHKADSKKIADPQRQAKKPRKPTKSSTGKVVPKDDPNRLTISVPDTDNWYAFMANAFGRIHDRWLFCRDRESRYMQGDPTIPTFKTWDECRNAMVRVARLYWEAEGTVSPSGRRDLFNQCWLAFSEGLKVVEKSMGIQYGAQGVQTQGRPLTQSDIRQIIRHGEPQLGLTKPFDESVVKKYARMLRLLCYRHIPGAPRLSTSDQAFLKRHWLPALLRAIGPPQK